MRAHRAVPLGRTPPAGRPKALLGPPLPGPTALQAGPLGGPGASPARCRLTPTEPEAAHVRPHPQVARLHPPSLAGVHPTAVAPVSPPRSPSGRRPRLP
ncbi:hypothetical protein SGM_6463 [Streptomyces griseoaurantiacus M045]|uniref:Uncharacterized protein n=1 Tax=Streptomyces griseoaurantiacus M045 TaxID=996637 RepID=F3NSX0_9ACTN|nr:hypothetical protein SGM_6463 [Streptomyces griseoaurantiacus M045]